MSHPKIIDSFPSVRILFVNTVYVLCYISIYTGPLGSLGAKKLGCRKACFLGGIILGCGFIASCFAQSPLQLFFTIGIITGESLT